MLFLESKLEYTLSVYDKQHIYYLAL